MSGLGWREVAIVLVIIAGATVAAWFIARDIKRQTIVTEETAHLERLDIESRLAARIDSLSEEQATNKHNIAALKRKVGPQPKKQEPHKPTRPYPQGW